jgi:hypothetical protein
VDGRAAWHDAAVPMLPDGPGTPGELLRGYCRQLAEVASWDRSVGDDAPRFGLSFRDRADALLAAAHGLAAHPSLSDDAELTQRVAVLGLAAAHPVTEASYNRDVIEAGHAIAERAEDALGVVWHTPDAPDVIEVPAREP